VNQCGVCEIHRAVPILQHESFENWKVGISRGSNFECARADETPSSPELVGRVTHHMKKLRKDRGGRQQRQLERFECFYARGMPAVIAIQKGENRTGVRQCASQAGSDSASPARCSSLIPTAGGSRPRWIR